MNDSELAKKILQRATQPKRRYDDGLSAKERLIQQIEMIRAKRLPEQPDVVLSEAELLDKINATKDFLARQRKR